MRAPRLLLGGRPSITPCPRAALPLSPAAGRIAAGDPGLAAGLATGGDDYELLFAAPPPADAAIGRLAAELGLLITTIGNIEPGTGVRLIDASGSEVPVETAGYRHF